MTGAQLELNCWGKEEEQNCSVWGPCCWYPWGSSPACLWAGLCPVPCTTVPSAWPPTHTSALTLREKNGEHSLDVQHGCTLTPPLSHVYPPGADVHTCTQPGTPIAMPAHTVPHVPKHTCSVTPEHMATCAGCPVTPHPLPITRAMCSPMCTDHHSGAPLCAHVGTPAHRGAHTAPLRASLEVLWEHRRPAEPRTPEALLLPG